jgi:hypothetical protein
MRWSPWSESIEFRLDWASWRAPSFPVEYGIRDGFLQVNCSDRRGGRGLLDSTEGLERRILPLGRPSRSTVLPVTPWSPPWIAPAAGRAGTDDAIQGSVDLFRGATLEGTTCFPFALEDSGVGYLCNLDRDVEASDVVELLRGAAVPCP